MVASCGYAVPIFELGKEIFDPMVSGVERFRVVRWNFHGALRWYRFHSVAVNQVPYHANGEIKEGN
ncbi:MAG: hypothetical protein LBQ23_02715 [Puniceicoccales bacterium]|nr:hypothetical protein [Puniceicoccales bacterium]